MGFINADLPDVDLATWKDRPHLERMRILALHWIDAGAGTPKIIHLMYAVKILFYIAGGLFFASLTAGIGSMFDVASWWTQPIAYQKILVWTILYEVLGLGASCGPLAFRFKPWVGGVTYWLRPGTIKLPPWADKNPVAGGSRRTWFDVLVYGAMLVSALVLLVSDGVPHAGQPEGSLGLLDPRLLTVLIVLTAVAGLRDRLIFLAARSEQYWLMCIMFAALPYVDMIVGLKLVMFAVWWGAAASKLGKHFSYVVQGMTTNAPLMVSKWFRHKMCRDYPNDIRPSAATAVLAHTGTVIEFCIPAILLLSTNRELTLVAAAVMVIFHIYITVNFPLAVPLEWNIFYCFSLVWLFVLHPAPEFGLASAGSPWLVPGILVVLFGVIILGNVRPDLISFLPSARYYAGNWATGMWAFRKTGDGFSMEERLDEKIVKSSKNQVQQLTEMYSREVGELFMQKVLAWRHMNTHGRALSSLMLTHLDDPENYTIREGEFVMSSVVGWQFGDGHLHNEFFIQAVQDRCNFAPGDVVVVILESQPMHRMIQHYRIVDAALGEIERGWVDVHDMIAVQPWLENGPIPFHVESTGGWPAPGKAAESRESERPSPAAAQGD
ncbi:DUF3556 domain-containing protein [Pseudonocardia eucalypti]|uniref:DUF3556 domain-containing protein n=1 Tax=Pseudonocardia eucalypti TaxID=648755 RepID=A0ABP9QDK5_9PSEU|nr:hypothetical protein [Pseudonocardia eucalypti]